MILRRAPTLLCAALGWACAAEPDPSSSASATTTSGTTDTPSTSTTPSTGDSTSSSESTTSDATTMTTAPPGDLPPPPEPKSCSLETVDPDADPALVIDAGDAAGQIPSVVGDALLRNCGCHYNTNMLMVGDGYIDYDDAQPLATWADFHSDFAGTFPTGFEDMPTYLAVEQRVVFSDPLPMPPFGCGAQDEDAKISAADLALFADWLAAGAPDGASYPGR